MPTPQRSSDSYSNKTAVIFLFNLIVGTGALALPCAIQQCGVIPGITLLLTLGLFSFITVTFTVEAMAAANAISRKQHENEAVPLVSNEPQENAFEITEKYEIGEMGILMTPRWSQVLIYFCLCVYLFGDLAIYEVVVATTVSEILCSNKTSTNESLKNTDLCSENFSLTVLDVKRLAIAAFILLLGPFVFFNLQKTKALQVLTVLMRWIAFFIMLIWSISRLYEKGAEGHPPLVDIKSIPLLFGTSVYSFMCQHSIPGLLFPISNKKHSTKIITFDFICIVIFYSALVLTAAFTFAKILPIYSLNFWEDALNSSHCWWLIGFSYYLALFPIFTLSTSFPIIGITLRNNLKSLILRKTPKVPSVWYFDKLMFPLLTILPPTILSIAVCDVQLLVGVVGSYAGAGVQYLIPCLLVQYARSQTKDFDTPNIHVSPFKHPFWLYAVYVWMILSLVLISVNYVLKT